MGIYIRLSREDENKKDVSESITNQKSLLLQYVKENNLRVYDIYIDDGYSGTNFDRPDFNRLIRDIELGRVNMVITKDMSRLGRDYIKTGELIEKYFPEHNVRYIAVTDNIDTFLDTSNNDIAPFKAIMNDMYAKDISKKIKSSLRAKQKEGKWVGGRCPFGYKPDELDKNHLVIDEEKAYIVKRIYEMSLNGLTCFKIAKVLSLEGVKTPAQYYDFEWKNNYNKKYGQWHPKTIKDILTNRIYTGDMIQNRRSKVNYKVKKVVYNKENDYIIVENTHDAIISKDIFYKVQTLIPKNVGRNEKKEHNLLDGLLYCGDCGHRISVTPRRKKDNKCYTICNYYRTYMKERLCTLHSNNYDLLESEILKILKDNCIRYIDKKLVKENTLNELKKQEYIDSKNTIKMLENEINSINEKLDKIYMDKLDKVINEEQFNRIKIKLDTELKIKEDNLNKLLTNNKKNEKIKNNNKELEKYINDYLNFDKLNRDLIINLIDKVEVFEDKTLNIYFTFSNYNLE